MWAAGLEGVLALGIVQLATVGIGVSKRIAVIVERV